jgi:hypothetical protein
MLQVLLGILALSHLAYMASDQGFGPVAAERRHRFLGCAPDRFGLVVCVAELIDVKSAIPEQLL